MPFSANSPVSIFSPTAAMSGQAGGGEYVSTQNAHEGGVLTLSTGPELSPCTRAAFLQGKRKVTKTPCSTLHSFWWEADHANGCSPAWEVMASQWDRNLRGAVIHCEALGKATASNHFQKPGACP